MKYNEKIGGNHYMKIKILLFVFLAAVFAVSCGNDAGEGRVELAISTEDGIENFGSIVPSSPNYATTPSWLNEVQVLAYAGNPATGTLLMDETYPARSLVSGEYLPVEVPAGRNVYFVVNAIDRNKVIQYAGTAGPVDVQANSVLALNVVMAKMVSVPVKNVSLTLALKYLDSNNNIQEQLTRCGINTSRIYANIYTRAVKIADQWVPTNPDNGFDYSVGGSYSSSQWTGGSYLSNMLQFITVRAEDNDGGVAFYGVRVYDSRWSGVESPLNIYMQHPSKLVVTLSGSSLPTTAKVQMYVNNGWRDLNVSNTFSSNFNPQINNPVVVDAPSGEGWFTGAPVQARSIKVQYNPGPGWLDWGSPQSIEVDWGVSSVTITGP